MNSDLEENFNRAINLCESELTHDGLIELLQSGTVAERQFAALAIESLKTSVEVRVFMNNLTGCDGKIREAVASRLDEFITRDMMELFVPYSKVFADATIDINANISRLVIDGISVLHDIPEFGNSYAQFLVTFIQEGLDEIQKIKFRDKKYVLNKQLFKIYWALEGLANFYFYVDRSLLQTLLEQILARPEYTIREKVAELLVKLSDDEMFSCMLEKVKLDENFYVRRVLDKLG